jgi:hypothetical protein
MGLEMRCFILKGGLPIIPNIEPQTTPGEFLCIASFRKKHDLFDMKN